MGHANRSWLDYAVGVDTQPGGLRLPADERCESNPDPDGYSYRYGHGYTPSKADSDSTTAA